jgi:predicted amidohydrolase YtcJ
MPIQRQAADVLILNANVRTLDVAGSTFRALATKGDRIVGGLLRELRDAEAAHGGRGAPADP